MGRWTLVQGFITNFASASRFLFSKQFDHLRLHVFAHIFNRRRISSHCDHTENEHLRSGGLAVALLKVSRLEKQNYVSFDSYKTLYIRWL